MQETLTLSLLDQLKAIADPLRQRMLESFSMEPMTTKQVAQQLGESPTKLYHHLNVLESAGLVTLVETRQNRGTVEKYYQAAARQFVVDHRLLALSMEEGGEADELQRLIINALEAGLSDARCSFDPGVVASASQCVPAIAGQTRIRTSRDKAAKLAEGLRSWLSDFQSANEDDGEIAYSVTLALHPIKKQTKE